MDDRTYFLLKRLHSLSGVVPIAGFVIFHLFENSQSVAGQEAFNGTVHTLRSLPYLYLLEVGLLAPIFFHAVLGMVINRTARHNVLKYGFRANWSYTLQRFSGTFLLIFIGIHLYHTRFAGIPSDQMFQYLRDAYQHPLMGLLYLLGVLSASFHLANGLATFAMAWGIVSGQKSIDLAWKACMGLGLFVAFMGVNSMLGFQGKGLKILFHSEPAGVQAPAKPEPGPSPAPTAAPGPKPAAKPAPAKDKK